MTEKATEIARENGEYRCERCHNIITLKKGDLIPACPKCGFDTFDLRNRRFDDPADATPNHPSLNDDD